MSQSQTPRERLEEKLDAISYISFNKQQVILAIADLMNDMVPLPWSFTGSEPEKTVGWNSCREAVLASINKILKEK